MYRPLLILMLLISSVAYADITESLNIEEEDGSPSTFPYKLKVGNASLTDNGDGTASLAGGGTPGGSNAQVQFNDASSFAGDNALTWNKSTNTFSISRDAAQTGYAILVSGDLATQGALANVSHDGSAYFGGGVASGGSFSQVLFNNFTYISSDTSGIITLGTQTAENFRLNTGTSYPNTVSADTQTGIISIDTGSIGLNIGGHLTTRGKPTTVTGFGTNPSVSGTDTSGKINVGTGGVASSGQLVFGNRYITAPVCFTNNESSILLVRAKADTTQMTADVATVFAASDIVGYFCVGRD